MHCDHVTRRLYKFRRGAVAELVYLFEGGEGEALAAEAAAGKGIEVNQEKREEGRGAYP